jgi:hypothetical protein
MRMDHDVIEKEENIKVLKKYLQQFYKLSCQLNLSIDLVLIDQQSAGKRSLRLMDTMNAKKR